jgi:hypothetical protein
MSDFPLTGGCQCGAVRFAAQTLGRASVSHCRMCQKAFGGLFGPMVDVESLSWTRGAPSYFQSSNLVKRGFCAACGTPLTFENAKFPVNVAIGAFDHAEKIAPAVQVGTAFKLPYVDRLHELANLPSSDKAWMDGYYAEVISYQHPDHDTETWPAR